MFSPLLSSQLNDIVMAGDGSNLHLYRLSFDAFPSGFVSDYFRVRQWKVANSITESESVWNTTSAVFRGGCTHTSPVIMRHSAIRYTPKWRLKALNKQSEPLMAATKKTGSHATLPGVTRYGMWREICVLIFEWCFFNVASEMVGGWWWVCAEGGVGFFLWWLKKSVLWLLKSFDYWKFMVLIYKL